jgi:uncharacterized protein
MALPAPGPDRTCLVTGASSGIGVEMARELASRGHGLTLVARREPVLREVAERLAGAHGVRVEVLAVDLTDADARAEMPLEVAERGLRVHVLINNAGFSTMGPVHRSDPDRELSMLRTDVEAVADLCSRFTPGMVERGAGAVLNVASTAAFQPLPGQAGYSASKAFVLAYTRAMRTELAGTGVSVTALCPGPVETGFVEASGLDESAASGAMPKFMWVPADRVAAEAIAGLEKGKAVVIPGAANKASAIGGHLVPRSLLMPLLARQHPALRE